MRFRHALVSSCALMSLALGGQAQLLADPVRAPFAHESSDLKVDERVIYGELANGVRYAVMENDTPEQTASLRVRLDVGSFNETDDELGLAHYLEHMAFNGSTNIPEGEMIKRLERHGLTFGSDTNAHTGFDETVYKLNLPNVKAEVLDEAFMLMYETVANLTLDAGAIDRERGIIHSEKRTRNTAGFRRLIDEWDFYSKGSGLIEHLPIGTDETIESLSAEQMRAFYDANYHPEKLFVVFVGDVPADEAIQRIKETFGELQGRAEIAPRFKPQPVNMRPGAVGYYQDPDVMTEVTLSVSRPYEETSDTLDTRRERIVENLAMAMLSERLRKESHKMDAVLLAGSANRTTLFETTTVSQVMTRSNPEDWKAVLALAERELRRALSHGFSQSELDQQVSRYLAHYQKNAKESATPKTHGFMGSGIVDQIVKSYGSERVLEHPRDALARFEASVQDLTLEEVEAVFRDLWQGVDNPMVYVSTALEIQDPEAEVNAVLAESRNSKVEPYIAETAKAFAYEAFGEPGQLVTQQRLVDVDAYKVRFKNNVMLNFKQTNYVDGQVYVYARVGDGALSLPMKDEGLRRLALNLLNQGGLEEHDILELNELLAEHEFSYKLHFDEDSDAIEFTGRATPSDLSDLMNLLTAFASAPGVREDAGELYKRRLAAWYPTHDATPAGVVEREFPRLVRSGDKRFGFPDLDGFLSADYDMAAEWLRMELTEGAIEITIVGDITREEAIDQVSRTFGALPERKATHGSYPDSTQLVFPEREEDIVTFTHAGESDQAVLRVYWPAPDASDPVRTQHLRVLRNIFRNRLVEEIRETEAAAYSPGVGQYSSDTFPDYGYMVVSLDLTPGKVKPMLARVEEVALELYNGSIDQDAFERALTPIREDLAAREQSNGYWLSVLADAQTEANGIQTHRITPQAFDTVTLNDVKALAKSVFEPGTSVRAQVVPSEE